MPSDVVWVAMISGGVTVASLGVQGWLAHGADKRRNVQENNQRAEDRKWSVRQRNSDQRREIYSEMLAVAEQINRNFELFDPPPAQQDPNTNSWSRANEILDRLDADRTNELINRFNSERARAALVAVDRVLIDVAREYLVMAQIVSSAAVDPQRRHNAVFNLQSLSTLALKLQEASRHDLDLEAWPIEDNDSDG